MGWNRRLEPRPATWACWSSVHGSVKASSSVPSTSAATSASKRESSITARTGSAEATASGRAWQAGQTVAARPLLVNDKALDSTAGYAEEADALAKTYTFRTARKFVAKVDGSKVRMNVYIDGEKVNDLFARAGFFLELVGKLDSKKIQDEQGFTPEDVNFAIHVDRLPPLIHARVEPQASPATELSSEELYQVMLGKVVMVATYK